MKNGRSSSEQGWKRMLERNFGQHQILSKLSLLLERLSIVVFLTSFLFFQICEFEQET